MRRRGGGRGEKKKKFPRRGNKRESGDQKPHQKKGGGWKGRGPGPDFITTGTKRKGGDFAKYQRLKIQGKGGEFAFKSNKEKKMRKEGKRKDSGNSFTIRVLKEEGKPMGILLNNASAEQSVAKELAASFSAGGKIREKEGTSQKKSSTGTHDLASHSD